MHLHIEIGTPRWAFSAEYIKMHDTKQVKPVVSSYHHITIPPKVLGRKSGVYFSKKNPVHRGEGESGEMWYEMV